MAKKTKPINIVVLIGRTGAAANLALRTRNTRRRIRGRAGCGRAKAVTPRIDARQ